ncbi:hypothetical protein FOA52_008059 [Chlamydomonas sp. UWO 241]|nr:hypothetical protein FOA52_008059 [Chlamydomonas sp. UWO 241]
MLRLTRARACGRAGASSAPIVLSHCLPCNRSLTARPQAAGDCAGSRRPKSRCCSSAGGPGEEDLYKDARGHVGLNVLTGVRELRDNITWTTSTVIGNESASFDGNVRLIRVTVADHVDILYGRKVQGSLDTAKWIASFTAPGQFVGVRIPNASGGEPHVCKRLFNIANSPYESRRDSAYKDASIIEIVAERSRGGGDEKSLADMGPGSQIEVSQIVGRGFSSLFNIESNVPSAVEAGRPLLVIALGAHGIVPVRALLNWTPIQAHATKHRISCLYVTKSATTAAFLPGWDLWREAGVSFSPLYTEVYDPEDPANASEVLGLLDQALFLREGGFAGIAGSVKDVNVVLAGMGREMANQVSKRLHAKGVEHERMLFCDFF